MKQTMQIEPRINTDETRMGKLVHEELTKEIIGAVINFGRTKVEFKRLVF